MSRGKVFAVSAVVAVLAAGIAVMIAGVGTATADEVRFQNVSEQGPDPFTAPTDVPKDSSSASPTGGDSSSSSSESSASTDSSQGSTSEPGGSGSSGDTSPTGGADGESGAQPEPGTFGGTGKNTVCDREKLIQELSQDPQKLSAWAETAGVEATPEAVGAYIRELRPSTLTQDTQVTNHSYKGGQATPYQAILEEGTAVLVDKEGKPVARCRCGNPLTEPVQLEQEAKCINCPANYQPPPPCDAKCYRPEPAAPPVQKPGDPLWSAKQALDECRKAKGDLEQCKALYEKAKALCAQDHLKDTPQCKDLAKTVAATEGQEEQGGDTGQEPGTGDASGETGAGGGTDAGTTGGEAPPQDGATTGESPAPDGGYTTP